MAEMQPGSAEKSPSSGLGQSLAVKINSGRFSFFDSLMRMSCWPGMKKIEKIWALLYNDIVISRGTIVVGTKVLDFVG